MIHTETEDTKLEIISIHISLDRHNNKREITALRFREVENILDYCHFTDSEFYSCLENLLLQWESFQAKKENVEGRAELILDGVQFEKVKLEEVLTVTHSDWNFKTKEKPASSLFPVSHLNLKYY